jgi:galactose mutarotase-like enzyme
MSIAGPNGELIMLEAGDYRATVASVGAGLVSLSFQGQDIVIGSPLAVQHLCDSQFGFFGPGFPVAFRRHAVQDPWCRS